MLSFAAINGHSPASKSSYLDQLRWYALGGFDLWNLWDNLSKFRCEGGTRTLIDAIQADSRAELRMGTAVKQVNQSTDGVQVITRRGEQISARSVIVAVPLNCLSDIEFNPGISQVKLAASRQRHTGSGTKIYARIKGKRPVFIGHGKQEMPLCFSWTEYDDPDSQILCGFGASPDYLDINDDEAVQQAFSAYMPGIEVLESYGYDWNLDPYAKGTWCMYPPGMLTSSLRELQRPEGHVFFAGADIANGWRGFIDGAVESGLSVAHQVTEKLS
jgi:monoamine oxidase